MKAFNKIFNIAHNKAGTTSLNEALNLLGFKSIHYKIENKRISDIIDSNISLSLPLLNGVENYIGYSDFGGYNYYKNLDIQYPKSKFILTTRSMEEWLYSREKHVRRNLKKKQYKYDFNKINKEKWKANRIERENEIRDYFKNRESDLLIIDIPKGDGWSKLCQFLNKDIPEIEFPKKNIKTRKNAR